MRLRPVRQNRAKSKVVTVGHVPAPSGGINSLDDISSMARNEAIELVNMIPNENGCELRGGKSSHVTGLGSVIRTLMTFSASDGTDEIFASTATDIYDVTVAGAVGSAVVTGLLNGDWQHTNFSNSAGNFLVCANGVDDVRYYNGSTWTTPSITGVTSSTLVNVNAHMSRLWFVEEDSLSVWYLPVNSVAGAATEIDLGPISKEGGYLVAMASWTRDGGEGMEDLAVFVTSKGEVHIFSGTDPDSASTWGRIGTYKIAPPVGRKCMEKFGGDVGVLTSQGLVPLSSVLGLAVSAQREAAATNKIRGDIQEYFNLTASQSGWQFIEVFEEGFLLINVPISEGTRYTQFVMSTRAGGKWGQFEDLHTNTWASANGSLYFGGVDGTVWKYGADDDDGESIDATIVHAFTDFGYSTEKSFKRFRPQFFGPPGYTPRVGMRIDFDEGSVEFDLPAPQSVGAIWDEAVWDVAEWAPAAVSSAKWYSIRGEGYTGAVIVKLSGREKLRYDGGKISFEVSRGI